MAERIIDSASKIARQFIAAAEKNGWEFPMPKEEELAGKMQRRSDRVAILMQEERQLCEIVWQGMDEWQRQEYDKNYRVVFAEDIESKATPFHASLSESQIETLLRIDRLSSERNAIVNAILTSMHNTEPSLRVASEPCSYFTGIAISFILNHALLRALELPLPNNYENTAHFVDYNQTDQLFELHIDPLSQYALHRMDDIIATTLRKTVSDNALWKRERTRKSVAYFLETNAFEIGLAAEVAQALHFGYPGDASTYYRYRGREMGGDEFFMSTDEQGAEAGKEARFIIFLTGKAVEILEHMGIDRQRIRDTGELTR